jgi:hypothetical protein
MSIAVPLSELAAAAAGQASFAYLLTVTDDATAHAVAVTVAFDDDALVCDAGRTSCANAIARPRVSFVWPPGAPGDYSLIVDGDASVADSTIRVTPVRAVRHRPASGGGNDCAPVALG